MLSYSNEAWSDCLRDEIEPLLREHWLEQALDQDKIELAPDWDRYALIAKAGLLHIVTARSSEGFVVGFYVAVLSPHLHYRNDVMAVTDNFFLQKEYRRGFEGLRFFRNVVSSLDGQASEIFVNTKLHVNPGAGLSLERVGFKPVGTVYAKVLKHG